MAAHREKLTNLPGLDTSGRRFTWLYSNRPPTSTAVICCYCDAPVRAESQRTTERPRQPYKMPNQTLKMELATVHSGAQPTSVSASELLSDSVYVRDSGDDFSDTRAPS